VSKKFKEIFYSLALGLGMGAIGVFLIGYIAAVAIPKEFFSLFENTRIASLSIAVISQFLAFGVIAICVGLVLGRLSKRWLLNSTVCYLAFLFYLGFGVALVYQVEISNPYSVLSYLDIPMIILVPLCL